MPTRFGPVYNVDLMVAVTPDPLGHRPGSHEFWLNNNNPWPADLNDAEVKVAGGVAADLRLVVGGTPVVSTRYRIGQVARWRNSRPVQTPVEEVPNATATGEPVTVRCTVAKAVTSPGAIPGPVYPLVGTLTVNL